MKKIRRSGGGNLPKGMMKGKRAMAIIAAVTAPAVKKGKKK